MTGKFEPILGTWALASSMLILQSCFYDGPSREYGYPAYGYGAPAPVVYGDYDEIMPGMNVTGGLIAARRGCTSITPSGWLARA